MPALIIYHKNCTDGACAAWAAQYHAERAGLVANLVPADPMRTPDLPEGTFDIAFIVDVCIPLDDLRAIDARTRLGCWVLDHHKTNREDVAGWERAVWDMERSGAGLAWDETQRLLGLELEARPGFVDYVEDRDLWRFKMPGSREVNAAICSQPREPETFERLAGVSAAAGGWAVHLPTLRAEGEGVLSVHEDLARRAADSALVVDAPSVGPVSLVTCPVLQSDVAGHLVELHARPAIIWYSREEEGLPVAQVSFRSADSLPDVSGLARSWGGGGHRNASGAMVPLPAWLRWVDRACRGGAPERVFIASPLRGDVSRNQAYARIALRDSLARGEAPFVPHLLYDQVLDDGIEEERATAIKAALGFLAGCDVLAVYWDLGISLGMRGEIELARALGIRVEERKLGTVPS